MCRAVVFDFDGTLADSYTRRDQARANVAAVLTEFLQRRDETIEQQAVRDTVDRIATEYSCPENRVIDRDQWWNAVVDTYDVSAPPDQLIRRATQTYWETIRAETTLYPGTIALLESLQEAGVPIGMITDSDGLAGMKRRRLAYSGLNPYLDATIVAGEDTTAAKPDTEPFEMLAETLDVPTEACVYVGDKPAIDIPGARAVGMTTVLVMWDRSDSTMPSPAPDRLVTTDMDALADSLRAVLAVDSFGEPSA